MLLLGLVWTPAASQSLEIEPEAYAPPRTTEGVPDLQGVWQTLNTAAWDIQDHSGD